MTDDTEVLVVGGGLSGYTAAATAAEAGCSVIVLEKTAAAGGNMIHSGSSFVFAGTALQEAAGIEDSPEMLREDLLRFGAGFSDARLVDAYVDNALETYEWMERIGITFDSVSLSGNQSRPRSHSVKVKESFDALARHLSTFPRVTVLPEHRVTQLRTENQMVVGVRAQSPRGGVDFRASRGVLLTTGGFPFSKRLIKTFAPRFTDAIPLGNPGAEGDGLYLAMALGADLADMGFLAGTFGTSAPFPGLNPEPILLICIYRGAIVVNSSGARFANESLSYKAIADLCLEQDRALGFQLFDEQVMRQTNPDKSVNDFAGALAQGYLLKAGTLTELARLMGADPAVLSDTVSRYNSTIAGEAADEFDRTSLSAGYGVPTPVNEPPFYAYPGTIGMPSTYGGVRVNAAMQVMHVAGAPINGLYAAGEIVGGFHGKGYISGTSLGKSAIFARVAGRSLAGR